MGFRVVAPLLACAVGACGGRAVLAPDAGADATASVDAPNDSRSCSDAHESVGALCKWSRACFPGLECASYRCTWPTGTCCSAPSDCATGACDGGVCACAPLMGACGSTADCCGGRACQNVAIPGAPTGTCCALAGSPCEGGAQCCSGSCTGGLCDCGPGPEGGTTCASDRDCCSGNCVARTGTGSGTAQCQQLPLGAPCTTDFACAFDLCRGGVCACEGPGELTQYFGLTPQCCNSSVGLRVDGGFPCTCSTSACVKDADCCSGMACNAGLCQ